MVSNAQKFITLDPLETWLKNKFFEMKTSSV